jgi:hypothetical protein
MMNIKDVVPELEDGFEEESTSDTLVKSQGGDCFRPVGLLPPARPADPLRRYYYHKGIPRE